MPLRAEDFIVGLRQATAWIEDYDPSVREVLALGFSIWAARFDGNPSVLPTEIEFPPEIPRVTLASVDRRWKLTLPRQRIVLTWAPTGQDDYVGGPEFARVAWDVFAPFLRLNKGIRTARLGYLVRRYSVIDDPSPTLARYFCREEVLRGPLNRPANFQLHAHKIYQPKRALPELNSWIRWRNGERTGGVPVISVEQELSTLRERARDAAYDADAVRTFLDQATDEADEIMRVYLPANQTSGATP